MTVRNFGQSKLWETYSASRFTADEIDLTGFKSSPVNYKLSMWDPRVNGVRYLRSLIYHMGTTLSDENLERLRRIHHRDLGAPIAVRCRGELMCTDYLFAVHELDFVAPHVPLDGARVLEIGAGFGRTCHTMMSNHDIASFHIVDLPNMLELSRAYLARVLPGEQFDRIRFVPVEGAEALFDDAAFDLAVNIDSMSEMDAGTVRSYLAAIDETCRWFYVTNPVAKYSDPSLSTDYRSDSPLVAMAMSTGLLREVIDVNDMEQVQAQVPQFLRVYRPGPRWSPVADRPHPAYPHYWQGLFARAES